MATLDDGLRTQIGNAYASGDYNTFNNLLTQNNVSSDTLKQSFNLGDSNLANATTAGTLTAYNQPAIQKFSDPGPTQTQTPTDTSQSSAGLPPTLRDTVGTMFQNKDYAGLNNTINQYGLTSDWAAQNFGLNQDQLGLAKTMGINFQGNPSNSVGAASTPPPNPGSPASSLYPTLSAPQPNINGSTQAAGPLFATPAAGSPDWMKQIVASGGQAYRDPNTGFQYLPHFSSGGDNPSVDGYRVLDPSTPMGANGLKTFKVLDSSGNDTGKTEQMGYPADWFTTLMPLVIGGLATFGIGSTIAGVAGAAGAAGAGAGTDAMTAAAASDAGGGSLGGAAPGLANPTAATGLEGITSGGTSAATTGSQGLNPAFDTLGNPADAGITGSPFTPATTQAPLPMGSGEFTAATSNLGNTLGPTPGFTPGSPFNPSLPLSLTGGTPNGTIPGISPSTAATAAGGLNGITSGGITPSTAANGLGSLISGLTGIATAVQSGNAQKDAANNMLDWLKSQQAKIDNLYQPGSPEYNLLMQQMAAKDAAAGRNSQYGVRSVDLAAKIAQIKAQYTAQLTAGIAGNMSTAFNQSANSNAGLDAILGNLTKPNAQGQSTLSNIVGQFF